MGSHSNKRTPACKGAQFKLVSYNALDLEVLGSKLSSVIMARVLKFCTPIRIVLPLKVYNFYIPFVASF